LGHAPSPVCFSYFLDCISHFCLGPALDHHPPTYELLCSRDYRWVPSHPDCWLRWDHATFFPGLALNCDLHDLCFWYSRSHCAHCLTCCSFCGSKKRGGLKGCGQGGSILIWRPDWGRMYLRSQGC
jgi:hypothetical protein